MKIALIHDWLVSLGGAERVLLALHKIFPKAPIYTFLFNQDKMAGYFSGAEIRPSFLQKSPRFLKKRHKYFLPIMPVVSETIDLSDFDVVISSSTAFAKGIITRPKTVHICYCHSPMRFVWDWYFEYQQEQFGARDWYWPQEVSKAMFTKWPIKALLHYLRVWDKSSAYRVDHFIANSRTTQARIKKYYRRDATVIYPPVALGTALMNVEGQNDKRNGYFLIVSRLAPYKKIDIAINAFNKLEMPLVVVGDGSDRKRLEQMAGPTIRFLGFQPDGVIEKLYQNCTAFIFPGEEDFGIAPVEAMAHGKPVLAYRRGGLCESVIEGMTGEFFDDPFPEILADGVRRLMENYDNYSPTVIRKRAEKFSEDKFENEFRRFVGGVI